MTRPELIGADGEGRRLFHLALDRAADWPAEPGLDAPAFGLFLACDAGRLGVDALSTVVERALDSGVAFICAWGPGCSLVDDLFDETAVMRQVEAMRRGEAFTFDDTPTVMTTWHERDTLGEALAYFRDLAGPAEDWPHPCTALLAATIAMPEAAQAIRRFLEATVRK